MSGPDEQQADVQPDECGPLELPPPDLATVARCEAAELAGIRAAFPHHADGITHDEDGKWRCRSGKKVIAETDGMGALHTRLLRYDREQAL